MRNLLIVFAVISIILVSGCTTTTNDGPQQTNTNSIDPQERCIELCRNQILSNVDMSSGPCLSEDKELDWSIEDWACDVAHEPRKDIDKHSINQCQEFRKENVAHFVEVTPNCEFIRKL
jgi:hypothetical protein